MILTIAARNIRRNGRRSFMAAASIAVGALAMLAFGAFMATCTLGLRTGLVREYGHLSLFKSGYFEFGSGNPAAYGISGYEKLEADLAADPVLKPMVRVVAATVSLFGVAGNPDKDTSKTFMGTGVVPSKRQEMRTWNEHQLTETDASDTRGLSDTDTTSGFVGIGVARVLGLCAALKQADCPADFKTVEKPAENVDGVARRDFSSLADETTPADPSDGARINLLGATATGSPNIVEFRVAEAVTLGNKAIDDMLVGMNIELAQKLVYGRGEKKVTSIALQLHHDADLEAARSRLKDLVKERGLDLEVRDYTELSPEYDQINRLFGSIFLFIAVVMSVIVLFTVVNTMSMSVMERINEIGTTRALGVRRSGIRAQFLAEGSILGALGAAAGVILSFVVSFLIDHSGIMWTPPGNTAGIPLLLPMSSVTGMIGVVWPALILMATIAALIPAGRAARMPVVDALRHV